MSIQVHTPENGSLRKLPEAVRDAIHAYYLVSMAGSAFDQERRDAQLNPIRDAIQQACRDNGMVCIEKQGIGFWCITQTPNSQALWPTIHSHNYNEALPVYIRNPEQTRRINQYD